MAAARSRCTAGTSAKPYTAQLNTLDGPMAGTAPETSSTTFTRHQFEGLNALRGIAAFGVLVFHTAVILGFQPVPGGFLAVDLFFVLSGFVLSAAYQDRLRQTLSVMEFIRLRLWRFYPLYGVGLIIGAFAMLLDALKPPSVLSLYEVLVSVVLGSVYLPVKVFGTEALYPLNWPSWSLAAEIVVNIVFAWLVTHRRAVSLKLVPAVCLITLIMLVLSGSSFDGGAEWPGAFIGLLRAGWGFFVGALLYRGGFHQKLRLPRYSEAILAAILVACLMIPIGAASRGYFDLFCAIVVFPAIVVVTASIPPSRFDGVYHWLGLISFPLYAVHWPLIQWVLPVAKIIHTNRVVTETILIVGALSVAFAAYFFDEWIRRQAFRRKP